MIRRCTETDLDRMLEIINAAAVVYAGHIPDDRYHQPYMTSGELRREIADGVIFYGVDDDTGLVAVMGYQDRNEVALIRHAYTLPECQGFGHGSILIRHLRDLADKTLLVGTWRAATWAIRFYENRGFTLVDESEKTRLLENYWNIPERQIETSVVLRLERSGRDDAGAQGFGHELAVGVDECPVVESFGGDVHESEIERSFGRSDVFVRDIRDVTGEDASGFSPDRPIARSPFSSRIDLTCSSGNLASTATR